MKALLACGLIVAGVLTARTQGTVNVANGAAEVDAPVTTLPDGVPVEGSDWQAELWMADTNGNWGPVSEPVPFLTQPVAGYFFGGVVTVAGVEAGQPATLRVRAFNANLGVEAASAPVTVTLGGDKMPPPNLVGLQPWSIALPPRLTIALAGSAVILSWPTNYSTFVLESNDLLLPTNWASAGPWLISTNGSFFTATVPTDSTQRYFRLRLN